MEWYITEGVLYNTEVTPFENGVQLNITGKGHVIIPEGVTSIGKRAFAHRSRLRSVSIPEGVTSIGDYAFSSCISLRSIIIPDSVTAIGEGAFYSCDSLTSISIPNSVTSIGDGAFGGCDSLTSISIPEGVTSIGDYAFSRCKSLRSIIIPNSVTSIGDYAFKWCDSLTSISISEGVTSIGDYAFSRCKSLRSIIIPNSVTSIGDYAFKGCDSLTSISIPGVLKLNFMTKKERESLTAIYCNSHVNKISAAIRPMVYVTFARHEEEYSDVLKKEYIAAIYKNVAKIIQVAFDYPELLYLMCRKQLISVRHIDAYIQEAIDRGNAEYTELLLNYRVAQLRRTAVSDARKRRKSSI